jgi:hypothetical protein
MTLVEWLAEQMLHPQSFNPYIEQAKEMEFEQRKKDFVNGYKSLAKESNLIFDEISEKHAIYLFNETFKSE